MNRGFTLVELSIVLMIIGLIVGGILVGRELLHAAEIRNIASQIKQYNTAFNVFTNKYGNQMPGDIRNAEAFGLGVSGGAGKNGNGDGILVADTVWSGTNVGKMDGELRTFWHHLSAARLIKHDYTGTGYDVGEDYPKVNNRSAGLVAYTRSQGGTYYILGVGTKDAGGGEAGDIILTNMLSPQEAFELDSLLDDGFASKGVVRSLLTTILEGGNFWEAVDAAGIPGSGAATECVTGGAQNYKYLDESAKCALQILINK